MSSFAVASKCNFSRLYAAPVIKQGMGKKRVDLFMDETSTSPSNKIKFQLCDSELKPIVTKYPLDQVRDDGDPTRRGQMVIVDDPATVDALLAFDKRMIELAVQHSKDWFGSVKTEEQVRPCYKSVLTRISEEDDYTMKFKVKCQGAQYPTKILRLRDAAKGELVPAKEKALGAKNAKIVPVLSAYGVYFISGGAQFGVSFQAESIIVVEEGVSNGELGGYVLSRNDFKVVETVTSDDGEGGSSSDHPEAKRLKIELDEDAPADDEGGAAM